MMNKVKEFVEKLGEHNSLFKDAFVFGLYKKFGLSEFVGDISKVFSVILKYENGEDVSFDVGRSEIAPILSFSFIPIILYYAYADELDKLNSFIEVYRSKAFGDLVLSVAYTGSKDLFDLFRKYYFDKENENRTMTFLLALDEILFRFTIDNVLDFVLEFYDHLDIEDMSFQIRQAAFSSYSAANFLKGKEAYCEKFVESLNIDSKEVSYYKLYPMLAKNLYTCGNVEASFKLFSNLLRMSKLSINSVGTYRFIVPPSPKSLLYVMKENLRMIQELFIKFEDFLRSSRFDHSELALELLMRIFNDNGDIHALVLAKRFEYLINKDDNILENVVSYLSQINDEEEKATFAYELGKFMAQRNIEMDDLEFVVDKLLQINEVPIMLEFSKGFYYEALRNNPRTS